VVVDLPESEGALALYRISFGEIQTDVTDNNDVAERAVLARHSDRKESLAVTYMWSFSLPIMKDVLKRGVSPCPFLWPVKVG